MDSASLTDHVVALWRLQSRYADVVTRRAWGELHDIFLPDTVVHIDTVTAPPRSIGGPDEFGSVIGAAMDRFDHFNFVILNTVVDVDEEALTALTATGRIFMCEVRHDAATDIWQTTYGVYSDRYVFAVDGGGWRIAERRYRSMARTDPDGAVFGLPPDLV